MIFFKFILFGLINLFSVTPSWALDAVEVNDNLILDHPAQGHVIKLPEEMQKGASYEMVILPSGQQNLEEWEKKKKEPVSRHLDLLLLKANRLFYEKDYESAMEMLLNAMDLSPQNPRVYNMLGSLYFTLQDKESARQYWTQSLSLNENQPEVKKFLEKVSSNP